MTAAPTSTTAARVVRWRELHRMETSEDGWRRDTPARAGRRPGRCAEKRALRRWRASMLSRKFFHSFQTCFSFAAVRDGPSSVLSPPLLASLANPCRCAYRPLLPQRQHQVGHRAAQLDTRAEHVTG